MEDCTRRYLLRALALGATGAGLDSLLLSCGQSSRPSTVPSQRGAVPVGTGGLSGRADD